MLATTVQDVLICSCGHKTMFHDVVKDLSYEMDPVFHNYSDFTEEVSCDSCQRSFEVLVQAEVSFDFSSSISKETTKTGDYFDKDHNPINASYFADLGLDDAAPNLWDGEYEYNGMIYKIIDEKVSYILSALIDPNQLSFDDVILDGEGIF